MKFYINSEDIMKDMMTLWEKFQTVNERTKKHTKDIQELRKLVKAFRSDEASG